MLKTWVSNINCRKSACYTMVDGQKNVISKQIRLIKFHTSFLHWYKYK